MTGDDIIQYSIDKAGFSDGLVCGALNFFDGWVVSAEKGNKITEVMFSIDGRRVGEIPVRRDRPDLEPIYKESSLGFYGVIEIPEDAIGKVLRVSALARDGQQFVMKEYLLTHLVSKEEKEYRKINNLPDDMSMYLVAHKIDPRVFLEEGRAGVDLIIRILGEEGCNIERLKNVLDFGVGCGRVMRWWLPYSKKVTFWGTDINLALVEWCKKNLSFGKYSVNSLHPPTNYRSCQFDLIYAFSVFTHLTAETQAEWLDEFHRLLDKDGYLILSVHGDQHAKTLPPSSYAKYVRSGYCVITQDAEGENLCATYENKEFCEGLFSRRFQIRQVLTGALISCGNQDLYVLVRK